MGAYANGNPECYEITSEAHQAQGNATCFQANLPHSCYESVDSKKLVRGISAVLHARTSGEETHKGDESNTNITDLFNNALCCAIGPCRDDPVVSPPDIEDTTNCLHKVEYEKTELS